MAECANVFDKITYLDHQEINVPTGGTHTPQLQIVDLLKERGVQRDTIIALQQQVALYFEMNQSPSEKDLLRAHREMIAMYKKMGSGQGVSLT